MRATKFENCGLYFCFKNLVVNFLVFYSRMRNILNDLWTNTGNVFNTYEKDPDARLSYGFVSSRVYEKRYAVLYFCNIPVSRPWELFKAILLRSSRFWDLFGLWIGKLIFEPSISAFTKPESSRKARQRERRTKGFKKSKAIIQEK